MRTATHSQRQVIVAREGHRAADIRNSRSARSLPGTVDHCIPYTARFVETGIDRQQHLPSRHTFQLVDCIAGHVDHEAPLGTWTILEVPIHATVF